MIPVNKPLFHLGHVVATPAALEELSKSGQAPWEFLARHAPGDRGELDAEDRHLNDETVKAGERILSAYTLKTGVRVWIITEADRSSTCLLLPDDY